MGLQLNVPGLDRDLVRNRINALLDKKSKAEAMLIKESTGIDPKRITSVLGAAQDTISMEFMAIFAQVLDVPLEYILYGKGPPLISKNIRYYDIPYIENAQSNEGCLIYNNNFTCAISLEFIKNITDDPKNIVLYKIQSDVMENTLLKGDELMIDLSKKFIRDGLIYAYNSDDFKCIRIRRFLVQQNRLKLIADNKEKYDSCFANKEDINIIGQAIISKHFF